jgi:hypothetical protein
MLRAHWNNILLTPILLLFLPNSHSPVGKIIPVNPNEIITPIIVIDICTLDEQSLRAHIID